MLVQPGNRSVRSCVRACERSCVCPRDDVVPVAGRFLGKSPPGRRRRRVPFPVVGLAVPSVKASLDLLCVHDVSACETTCRRVGGGLVFGSLDPPAFMVPLAFPC